MEKPFPSINPAGQSAFPPPADPQRPHPPVQMTAIDAHQFSRPRDVAIGFVQLSLNELTMISIARLLKRGKTIRRSRRFSVAKGRQVLNRHAMILMHDHNPFDRVSQLAYIARPRISLHDFDRVRLKLLWFLSVGRGEPLVEVID